MANDLIIAVNGNEIDYQLENEGSLGEVFAGVSDWLSQSGGIIRSINVDGENFLLADDGWKDMPLKSVRKIEIQAVDIRSGKIIQLETLKDFFVLTEQTIEQKDEAVFQQLSAAYDELRTVFLNLFEYDMFDTILASVDSIFQQKSLPSISEEQSKSLKILIALVDARFNEMMNPKKQAQSIATVLALLASNFDDVSVQMQTGQDKQALDTIIRLTELLQSLLRCMKWIEIDQDTAKLTDNINRILVDLEEALQAKDTILIGDLLEYEMKPLLIALPKILQSTKEAIK